MNTNAALNYQPFREALGPLASVTRLDNHKENRIEKTLNANVHVVGCGNVKLKNLFCPSNRGAVVVIRRRDGSYSIPAQVYQKERSLPRLRLRTNKINQLKVII